MWRISRLTSPTTWQGVCRNRSSERVTTPSVYVLDPDDAELRAAAGRRVEDLVEVGAVGHVGRATEVLEGGLLAEGADRAEHGDALRGLQRQAGGHDRRDTASTCSAFSGPGLAARDLVDDLGHAVRAEEGRAFGALDLADLLGDAGALVQQFQQLLVQAVDLVAQREQGLGSDRLSHGEPQNPS